MLEIRLLGPFEVRLGLGLGNQTADLPSRPAQSLLAYLLLNPGAHRREMLAGLLWPDANDTNARRNLRQALWLLRRVLEAGGQTVLAADDITISFNATADHWLDVRVLEQAPEDIDGLMRAVEAYRGQLLPGFYEDWLVLERERLQMIFESRMGALINRLVEANRWQKVLEWGERWVSLSYAPEPAYRALMIAHASLNNLSAVGAAYQRCRDALSRELGVEPSEQTEALYQSLRSGQKPANLHLMIPAAQINAALEDQPPAPGEPPFMGLQSFEAEDSDLFFGRERLIDTLMSDLRAGHVPLFVIGASGSGKSSVLRAGVIPAIQREGAWQVHLITPTHHPMESLSSVPICDVLIVDQFEEVFTLCDGEAERRQFIDAILSAPARVVVALRADFYAHCAQYAALREALALHQQYIGPMNAEELRRAIEEPARRCDWEFEPGLVDLMLRDAGGEPGALPLLSHALLETWKRRRGHLLTLKGYAESGGVRGAIARTADSVIHQLPPQQQMLARSIFMRLTEFAEFETGTDTRRRAGLDELVPSGSQQATLDAVLDLLVDARLITIDSGSVEVSHEALIREWPMLRQWLQEDREGLQTHRHLTEAAQDWDQLDRDEGEVYRGARLAQAREWASTHWHDLNTLEQAFLTASIEGEDREAAAREAQHQRELQAGQRLAESESHAAKRLRRRALLLAGALLLVAVLAGAAIWFSQMSVRNARVATSRELASAAIGNLEADPELSILLALYALDQSQTMQARDALYRAVQASRVEHAFPVGNAPALHAAYTPDASRIVTVGVDGTVQTWDTVSDAGSKAKIASFELPIAIVPGLITSHSLSSDGSRVAVKDQSRMFVYDATTGDEIAHFELDSALGVALNGDGSRLAVGAMDGIVRVYYLDAPDEPIFTVQGIGDPVANPFFSADGSHIGAVTAPSVAEIRDAQVIVWDATSGEVVIQTPGKVGALSPDGSRLAVMANTNITSVWNVLTGVQIYTLVGHKNLINTVGFSPDGTRIVTGGLDRTARLWDANTGTQVMVLGGHTGGVLSAAFSPDGTHLITTSEDASARIWNYAPRQGVISIPTPTSSARVAYSPDGAWAAMGLHGGPGRVMFWDAQTGEEVLVLVTPHTTGINAVAFSPDGTHFATASHDRTVGIWSLIRGADNKPELELLHRLSGHGAATDGESIYGLAFSPDGTRLVSSSFDGSVKLWDVASGKELLSLNQPMGVPHVVFSPDGTRIATASFDSIARVWSAADGSELLALRGHRETVWGVAYNPDGSRIVTAGYDGTARVWDAQTGKELLRLSGHTSTVVSAAFSPDGAHIATASRDATAKVWDASTGQDLLTLSGGSVVGLNSAVFSPDGARLAVAGSGEVRIFALVLDDLVALARSRLTRSFTDDECIQYLHEEACPPGW